MIRNSAKTKIGNISPPLLSGFKNDIITLTDRIHPLNEGVILWHRTNLFPHRLGEPDWLFYAGNCHHIHDIADAAAAEGERIGKEAVSV